MVALDRWVLQSACDQLARWQRRFLDCRELKVSVNLSSRDLYQQYLLQDLKVLLAKTNLSPGALTLEITESMLIQDLTYASQILSELKDCNLKISIDDFGTGYSECIPDLQTLS